MTYQDLDAILRTVCPDTYSLAAPSGARRCIVWVKDAPIRTFGDNAPDEYIPTALVYVLTEQFEDPILGLVQAALDVASIPYSIQSLEEYSPDQERIVSIYRVILL